MAALIATFSQGIPISPIQPSVSFSEISLINASTESSEPDRQEENEVGLATQVLLDTFAVFGAMFVAGIAIIIVSVYVSRLRKRQQQQMALEASVEAARQEEEPSNQPDPFAIEKPSTIRKILRSILFRLRGQEQHKDVCEIPPHLRAQLKQIYVY